MRRWIDGDEFDYRSLIDYAVERKAGLQPSERLYIKKIKQQRDVAALLLIDMSKSTANPVPGSQKTVMDIAKESVVLFCEALKIVGDTFAIARIFRYPADWPWTILKSRILSKTWMKRS